MQQTCKTCGKPIQVERLQKQVSCTYCYTDFRVDNHGRLVEMDLDEVGVPESAAKAANAPIATKSSKEALARLLDDGEDAGNLTFIKDGTAKLPKEPERPATKSVAVPPPSDEPQVKLEFIGGETKKKKVPPPTAQIPEIDLSRPSQVRNKGKKPGAGGLVEVKKPKELEIEEEPDQRQTTLIAVAVVAGILIVVGGVMLALNLGAFSSGAATVGAGNSSVPISNLPSGTQPEARMELGTPVEDVLEQAKKGLAAGTYADANEAVLLLEAARRVAGLSAVDRSAVDVVWLEAVRIRDKFRLLEQANAHLAKADGADPLRASLEKFFALELLRRVQADQGGSSNFDTLNRLTEAALRRAQAID